MEMWSERVGAEVRAKSGWETGLQGLVTELATGSGDGGGPSEDRLTRC